MLDRAEWVGVPVIAIGELCTGFAKGSRFEKNLRELDEFLALPVVMINELRRAGDRFRLTMSGSRRRACAPARRCSGGTLIFGRFRGWSDGARWDALKGLWRV